MTDPLDELVAEGQSKRRAEKTAEKRSADQQVHATNRETNSRLWASASSYARWQWWAWATVATIATAVALHLTLDTKENDDGYSGIAILASVPFFWLAWKLRATFGRRAIADAEARLRALPFRVSGYAAALANNRTEGTSKLVVKFGKGDAVQREDVGFRDAGAVIAADVDEKTLADAFFSIGATLAKEPRKSGARVIEWEASSGESSYSDNAHLEAFIWRAMRVLEAIHARQPIESVEINGFQ